MTECRQCSNKANPLAQFDFMKISHTMASSKSACIEYCESVEDTTCCHYMEYYSGSYDVCDDDGCFCGAYRYIFPSETGACGLIDRTKFAEICRLTQIEVTRGPTVSSSTCNVLRHSSNESHTPRNSHKLAHNHKIIHRVIPIMLT